MRATQVGTLLRVLGLAIGVAAVTALLLGFDASHLSPFWIKVAIYKLAFIAALVLLIAGAMVGRRARARSSRN
jgi:hypothetical protein